MESDRGVGCGDYVKLRKADLGDEGKSGGPETLTGVEGLPEAVAEADDFEGAVGAHDAFLAGLGQAAAETEIPSLWFFDHAGVTLLG